MSESDEHTPTSVRSENCAVSISVNWLAQPGQPRRSDNANWKGKPHVYRIFLASVTSKLLGQQKLCSRAVSGVFLDNCGWNQRDALMKQSQSPQVSLIYNFCFGKPRFVPKQVEEKVSLNCRGT